MLWELILNLVCIVSEISPKLKKVHLLGNYTLCLLGEHSAVEPHPQFSLMLSNPGWFPIQAGFQFRLFCPWLP